MSQQLTDNPVYFKTIQEKYQHTKEKMVAKVNILNDIFKEYSTINIPTQGNIINMLKKTMEKDSKLKLFIKNTLEYVNMLQVSLFDMLQELFDLDGVLKQSQDAMNLSGKLTKQINDLTNEKARLSSQNQSLIDQINSLQNTGSGKDEEIGRLINKIKELESIIDDRNNQIEQLRKQKENEDAKSKMLLQGIIDVVAFIETNFYDDEANKEIFESLNKINNNNFDNNDISKIKTRISQYNTEIPQKIYKLINDNTNAANDINKLMEGIGDTLKSRDGFGNKNIGGDMFTKFLNPPQVPQMPQPLQPPVSPQPALPSLPPAPPQPAPPQPAPPAQPAQPAPPAPQLSPPASRSGSLQSATSASRSGSPSSAQPPSPQPLPASASSPSPLPSSPPTSGSTRIPKPPASPPPGQQGQPAQQGLLSSIASGIRSRIGLGKTGSL